MKTKIFTAVRCAAVAASLFALPMAVHAQTWQTTLSGLNEVPANGSGAMGTALVTYSAATHILTVSEIFSGLTSTATGAHIHCCSAPGVNSAVAVPFNLFPAATSGTYFQTFDLSTTAVFTSTFVTQSTLLGMTPEAALLAGLNGGLAYANLHDATFPGGEIRGQLLATPEPASIALMAAGLLAVGLAARRRKGSAG